MGISRIAAITARAVRGEIDFAVTDAPRRAARGAQWLRARVYDEPEASPGASAFRRTRRAGAGRSWFPAASPFSPSGSRLAGPDHAVASTLEIADRLTGRIPAMSTVRRSSGVRTLGAAQRRRRLIVA
jgi:hypothetical protein